MMELWMVRMVCVSTLTQATLYMIINIMFINIMTQATLYVIINIMYMNIMTQATLYEPKWDTWQESTASLKRRKMKIHQSANSLPACHHSLIGDNISELWLLVFRSLHVARQDFILLILQVDRHAGGDEDKEEEGEVDLIAGEGGEELDHRHPPSPPLTGSGLDKRSTILGSLGPQTGIRGLKRGVVQAAASHWLEPAATAANKILRTLVKVSGKKR